MRDRGAVISPCGTWRYLLWRRLPLTLQMAAHPGPSVVTWIMLNPSTADAETDDPTIRRVTGFTRSWGHGVAQVVNLFALRATDPSALLNHSDPVGPDNDQAIIDAVRDAAVIVCAWGSHKAAEDRAVHVARLAFEHSAAPTVCLGRTINGQPQHPLYVPRDERPCYWPLPRGEVPADV